MTDTHKLVLVGMPGSGKSTIGKRVARLLHYPFYDLDHEIELREGRKITEIFGAHGEDYFRGVESEVLVELLNRQESLVLSTGGGAPCFNRNMETINERGVSVYLDVPLDALLSRLTNTQVGKRPLFAGLTIEEIRQKLISMHQLRSSYYERAKIKLSGEAISAEQLVSEWVAFSKTESNR